MANDVADITLIPFRGSVDCVGQVSVRLSRTFNNGVTLELGVAHTVTYTSTDELSDIYTDILSTLAEEMRVQVSNLASSGAGQAIATQTPETPAEKDGDGNVVISVEKIGVETRNGKRYYKVFGGQWNKFGVRCWIEDASVCNEDFRESLARANPNEQGFLMTPDTKASIQIVNGRPTKAVKIWRVS